MRKLTDEELSRALGMHAAGQLNHQTFGLLTGEVSWRKEFCGCIASAALNLHERDPIPAEALDISGPLFPHIRENSDYAETPEDLLQFLADRGLA